MRSHQDEQARIHSQEDSLRATEEAHRKRKKPAGVHMQQDHGSVPENAVHRRIAQHQVTCSGMSDLLCISEALSSNLQLAACFMSPTYPIGV